MKYFVIMLLCTTIELSVLPSTINNAWKQRCTDVMINGIGSAADMDMIRAKLEKVIRF